jgi:hypothetical protein
MRSDKYSLKNITPKLVNDLIRVGNKEKDGGYVISKRQIEKTKVLLGLGINYDWTFEEDFKKHNSNAKIYCFDFSVGLPVYMKSFISSTINILSLNSYTKEVFNKRSPLPIFTKPIADIVTYFSFRSFFKPEKGNFFFPKGISDTSSTVFITVDEMFTHVPDFNSLPENSMYIKMDIEQSEYDILEYLLDHKLKINGFAVEFHDLKHFWKDFSFLTELLNEDYAVVHVHGNNCCGYIPGTEIPNFIEVSFIKKNLLSAEEINSHNNKSYPLDGLDKPNLTNRSDLKISFS